MNDPYCYDWDRDIARTRKRLHDRIDLRCNTQLRLDAMRRVSERIRITAEGFEAFRAAMQRASDAALRLRDLLVQEKAERL